MGRCTRIDRLCSGERLPEGFLTAPAALKYFQGRPVLAARHHRHTYVIHRHGNFTWPVGSRWHNAQPELMSTKPILPANPGVCGPWSHHLAWVANAVQTTSRRSSPGTDRAGAWETFFGSSTAAPFAVGLAPVGDWLSPNYSALTPFRQVRETLLGRRPAKQTTAASRAERGCAAKRRAHRDSLGRVPCLSFIALTKPMPVERAEPLGTFSSPTLRANVHLAWEPRFNGCAANSRSRALLLSATHFALRGAKVASYHFGD